MDREPPSLLLSLATAAPNEGIYAPENFHFSRVKNIAISPCFRFLGTRFAVLHDAATETLRIIHVAERRPAITSIVQAPYLRVMV